MSFLLNMERKRLKELTSRDYNIILDNSTHYKNVYIHTICMTLSDKHYNHILCNDFPRASLKHFTMFTSEPADVVPLVVSKLDGVSETYDDARPYLSVFYTYVPSMSECYSLNIESRYDPLCGKLQLSYYRDFGSRLILFRENVHDHNRLIATGTWKMANGGGSSMNNTNGHGHYYLGSSQIAAQSERDMSHLNDSVSEFKYECKKFIMFTSISNCKEVYDFKHLKNFAIDFGGKIVIDQNYMETFVNKPRIT